MKVENMIAEYISDVQYDDLSTLDVKEAKKHLLDTIAVMVSGSSAPGIKELLTTVSTLTGKGEATVCVFGNRVAVTDAALVNGTMAHARDFDDNHDLIAYKASVSVVPALLAMSERLGKISGKEFLTAYSVGVDIGCRIGLAIRPKPAHAYARSLGCFASAAACAKLLGLDKEQILDALGIAYTEVGVGGITISGRALTKRLGIGIAARAGVLAALLAQNGYHGPEDFLTGENGYYQSYIREAPDIEELTFELGRRFEIRSVGIKPYPCCRYVHGTIDGVIGLMKDNSIQRDEIKKVEVEVCKRDYDLVGGGGDAVRLEVLRKPQTVVDAQFSIPYVAAVAATYGQVTLDNLTGDGIRDEEATSFASRVIPKANERIWTVEQDVQPTIVRILLVSGKEFERRIENPKGSMENPVSWEDIIRKFNQCIKYAAFTLPSTTAIPEYVANLEDQDNCTELITMLAGQSV